MPDTRRITTALDAHLETTQSFFTAHDKLLAQFATAIAQAFSKRHRMLICGNGGSACDAMHIAGEFVGRFRDDRAALPAIALSADSGILSAVGNDYGFDQVFARQVEAYGSAGDILLALSTSGQSPNVIKALDAARKRKMTTALFTGQKGSGQTDKADYLFPVPSMNTARIQEVHITALHILAELVEEKLF